jgi:hypothetical protein
LSNLNQKLLKEVSNPFHAYLIFSNSSNYLVDQAKMFSNQLVFGEENNLSSHPDIRFIESENVNTLGIDDVREVIAKDNLSPLDGKYKIIVFPPNKSLTEEASNALLKTIEEPSESSIFILLSNSKFWSHAKDDSSNEILNTIKSRCRTIYLNSEQSFSFDFSIDDFSNYLNNHLNLTNIAEFKQVANSLNDLENFHFASGPEKLKKVTLFLNECNSLKDSLPEEFNISLNKLVVECLRYLSASLISRSDINKNRYRFAEQLEEAMSNIQNGMRPLVVLSELTTEKASL